MRRLLSILCVALLACSPKVDTKSDSATPAAATASASDGAAVKQAIDSALMRFTSAFVRADTAAAAAEYASDAIVMQPNQKATRGHDQIRQSIAGFFAGAKVSSFTTTTDSVVVVGDYAFENGAYQMTFTPKGGKPVNDVGKYLTVWQRQPDGKWKMIRDINNTDLPAR